MYKEFWWELQDESENWQIRKVQKNASTFNSYIECSYVNCIHNSVGIVKYVNMEYINKLHHICLNNHDLNIIIQNLKRSMEKKRLLWIFGEVYEWWCLKYQI